MSSDLEKLFNEYKNNCPPVKTLIHWYDLYEGHSIKIEENFLTILLKNAVDKAGNISNLGRKIKVPRKVLSCIINKKNNQKIITLRKIAEYLNYPLDDIDKKVIEVSNLKPKLPFDFNTEKGAEIRAAFLSDGHNDKSPTAGPQYHALEEELHKSLMKQCKEVFGEFKAKTSFNGRTNVTRFPAVIGSVLELSGVPRGNKTLSNCYLPRDILLGDKKIQAAYLRRCFDDEGDVCFDPYGKRAVRLTRSTDITTFNEFKEIPSEKWIRFELPNSIKHNLLCGERLLLLKLNIDARLYPEGIYKSKLNRITAKWRIQIGQQDQLRKFSKLVNFSLISKKEKLNKILKSYQFRKLPNGEGRRQALSFIKKVYKEKGYFKFKDLGKELVRAGRSYDLAGMYLKEFVEKGIIKKIKRGIYVFKSVG